MQTQTTILSNDADFFSENPLTQRNDIVYGLGGDDEIRAAVGDNTLFGGDGNDKLLTGNSSALSHNYLSGDEGNDTLFGGHGDDTLKGGSGNDLIRTGDGNNLVEGGLGADTFVGGTGNDTFGFHQGDSLVAAPDKFGAGGFGANDKIFLDAGASVTFGHQGALYSTATIHYASGPDDKILFTGNPVLNASQFIS